MIQLVAVQMRLDVEDFWSKDAFRSKIQRTIALIEPRVDRSLPSLVVYPEDVGLMLVAQGLREALSGVDTVERAIARSIRAMFWRALVERARSRLSWVPALFMMRRCAIAGTYFEVFEEAARELGAYVVAGSVPLPPCRIEDGRALWQEKPRERRVYNASFIFDPRGRVIGSQRKVYLTELEQRGTLDLAQAALSDLSVVRTPLGVIGVAVCLDCFQDDVALRLVELGAEILVQPSANPAPWTPEQQAEWRESAYKRTCVQKLFAYAVNPMMTGNIWNVAFYGQSSIVGREGVLAEAESDDGEEVLVVRAPHPALVLRNRD